MLTRIFHLLPKLFGELFAGNIFIIAAFYKLQLYLCFTLCTVFSGCFLMRDYVLTANQSDGLWCNFCLCSHLFLIHNLGLVSNTVYIFLTVLPPIKSPNCNCYLQPFTWNHVKLAAYCRPTLLTRTLQSNEGKNAIWLYCWLQVNLWVQPCLHACCFDAILVHFTELSVGDIITGTLFKVNQCIFYCNETPLKWYTAIVWRAAHLTSLLCTLQKTNLQ